MRISGFGAGIDRSQRCDVRSDQRQARFLIVSPSAGCVCKPDARHFGHGRAAGRRGDGGNCIGECLRFVRFHQVSTDRIQRSAHRHRLAINGEHGLIAGLHRNFLHVVVVKAVWNCEAIHFHSELLLDHLLRARQLVLQPLFILRRIQFFLCDLCRKAVASPDGWRSAPEYRHRHHASPRVAPNSSIHRR